MNESSISVLVAFSAGLLSFLSPCVLPLVPSYASFITGMSLDALQGSADAERRGSRALIFTHALLFVSGFSLVFIILGASATFIGAAFNYYSEWIARIGGALLVAFGLYLLGVLRLPGADREWRFHLADKPMGYAGTLLVGIAFGAGWTPCIGPVLGGILTMAATRESVGEGVGLLSAYSAGLAIPFLLATVAIDRFMSGYARFRRWIPWVTRVSGVLLITVGILMMLGSFSRLAAMLARYTPQFILERL
jgi:cytochrome c-type biogenesis protein